MFETLWEFVCAHWIWFPALIVGGFVYIYIGYLLLLAKLKVTRRHIKYNPKTCVYSIVLGFWTFIFFPQISFERLGGGDERLQYEETPRAAYYVRRPKEESDYPVWVVVFWPLMPIWLILYVVVQVFALLLISFSMYLPYYLIVGSITLVFKFFTLPIRKSLQKLEKTSESQR